MASHEELKAVRLLKKELLEAKGICAYPSDSYPTHAIDTVVKNFDELLTLGQSVTLVGRILSKRGQGAILFIDIFDGHDRIQAVLKKDIDIAYSLQPQIMEAFELFKDTVDMGDFIEVTGNLIVTRSGQNSLEVTSWRMLTKSIIPIPDEWYGIKSDDDRFRKRYLDILLSDELKDLFKKKAKFWSVTRRFFEDREFMEVETPTLEITTGGAEARPFQTHHNDFDIDVYMRISVGELWQKRLMAAGFHQTFELGRAYRNEGSSPEHLQEFTNLECYAAFMNLEDGKNLVKELYQKIAHDVFGTTQFTTRGHSFDLAGDWIEIDYVDEIKKHTGIDVLGATAQEMEEKLKELEVKFDGKNKERMTDSLWKFCRKKISGPAFLINHPKIVAPLSKEHKDDPLKTEMFQVIIAGSEIGRAHAELNDPIEQAKRFDIQNTLIKEGDDEAMMPDHEYVEMLEYGMPPVFGFGFGERLFSFFVDKPIREVQLFPLMRPKD